MTRWQLLRIELNVAWSQISAEMALLQLLYGPALMAAQALRHLLIILARLGKDGSTGNFDMLQYLSPRAHCSDCSDCAMFVAWLLIHVSIPPDCLLHLVSSMLCEGMPREMLFVRDVVNSADAFFLCFCDLLGQQRSILNTLSASTRFVG